MSNIRLEDVVESFDAGRSIGVPFASLKRLAATRYGLTFNKTDKLDAVMVAIKSAASQDSASHAVDPPAVDPPAAAAFPRAITTEIAFQITAQTDCASNLPLQLLVNERGRCLWNDIVQAVVEAINQTPLKESDHTLLLMAPHRMIQLQKQDQRYACVQDQGQFTFDVDESTVFRVEATEVSNPPNFHPPPITYCLSAFQTFYYGFHR